MEKTIENELEELLLNDDNLLMNTVRDINSYDCSLEHLIYYNNDEEFFNTFFKNDPMGAVRATFYGDYRYNDEYVKFNSYDNIESRQEWQIIEEMESCIDEIIEKIIELKDSCYFDSDIESLFEEMEENENE